MPLDTSRLSVPVAAPTLTSIGETGGYKLLPPPGVVSRVRAWWVGQRIETAAMSLRVRSPFPFCGEMVRLGYKVRNGHRVSLCVDNGPPWLVSGHGTIGLRAKGEAIAVSVTDQNIETCGTRIEPRFEVPRLSSLRWAAPPVAGSRNVVSWKVTRADVVFLAIQQGDVLLYKGPVRRRGQQTVALESTDDVRVTLAAKSRHHDWNSCARQDFILEAPVRPPAVSFDYVDVPDEIVHGEHAVVRWSARNASWVNLRVRRGASYTETQYPSTGACALSANALDTVEVRLIAEPRWKAEDAPDGSVTVIHLVRVKPPQLSIKLSAHTLRGTPGTHARLAWTIAGAQASWIDAPARGQHHVRIPPSGVLPVDIHVETETITFIATSATGQTTSEQVTVGPDLYNQML
jgi:hypothetical protein